MGLSQAFLHVNRALKDVTIYILTNYYVFQLKLGFKHRVDTELH